MNSGRRCATRLVDFWNRVTTCGTAAWIGGEVKGFLQMRRRNDRRSTYFIIIVHKKCWKLTFSLIQGRSIIVHSTVGRLYISFSFMKALNSRELLLNGTAPYSARRLYDYFVLISKKHVDFPRTRRAYTFHPPPQLGYIMIMPLIWKQMGRC